jgi:chemosensory pili system protein ChpA (sensor histidine kinase/response regulator)
MMRTLDPEIRTGFLEEARGCLPAILAGIEQLDQQDLREESSRLCDCIKGAAALVGLPGLAYIAAQIQEALDDIGNGLLPADDDARRALRLAGDLIESAIEALAAGSLSEAALLEAACGLFRRLRREPEEGDETALADVMARLDAQPAEADFDNDDLPVFDNDDLPVFETPTEAPSAPFGGESANDESETVDPELLEIFMQEAEDHLKAIRTFLPALESGDAEAVGTIRRSAHTLKGSAAMVGFRSLTRLAHRMEDILDRLFDGGQITPETLDLLKASADGLEDLAAGQMDAAILQSLHTRYDILLGEVEAPEIPTANIPEDIVRSGLSPVEGETARPSDQAAAESFVRVPLQRLDELVRLVSDLTILGTSAEQRQSAFSQRIEDLQRGDAASDIGAVVQDLSRLSAAADDQLERQARLISDIRDRLMHIRLTPFGTLTARLRRTVRQVAESSHKLIDFMLEGATVELDKAVLEEMAEPLMHLLRNAVDHGIETPERRRQEGKSEAGRITVLAAHEGDQIVVRVKDDGGGVNLEAVRTRAVERGLAPRDAAARLTEAELLALPFQPGFSTARTISETSGRGVGLDVVRTCVERLNGSVSLTSKPGEGTSFVVRLPMTVAVLRVLLVKARGQTFALPLASVARVVRLGGQGAEERGEQIRIGEEWVPRVVLGEALGLPKSPSSDVERPSVLLIEAGDARAAVVVDQVQGGQEIVVKTLGTHLRNIRGVSGATVMGDGAVVLILNPADLAVSPARSEAPASRALSVLVVDDSPSVRRVLTNLIRNAGWTVRTACDGLEALNLLAEEPAPDVVLLDVDMPRMDGFEFLAAVKSQETHREVPVVMLTSRSDSKSREKARNLGADGYVVKPYSDKDLLRTISGATAKARV